MRIVLRSVLPVSMTYRIYYAASYSYTSMMYDRRSGIQVTLAFNLAQTCC